MSLLVGVLIGFIGYISVYFLILAIKKKKSKKDNNITSDNAE